MATPEKQENYFVELGGAGSRFLNALLGGDSSVTLSAASWKNREYWWGRLSVRVIDVLNFRDPDHCRRAWDWHHERGLV